LTGFILDASVAAKWILPAHAEPLGDEAVRILKRFNADELSLWVPDLFWCEIGNVLWKAVRIGRMTQNSAASAIDRLARLNMYTVPTSRLVPEALSIAIRYQRSVYDAIYVAAAIDSGRPLVTADERLANALGGSLPVRWLGSPEW
jgi:predicted nucleic acid-binding protein